MKLVWIICIGIILLILIAFINTPTVENFGVFGCTPIPYDKLLKDIYTKPELIAYLKKDWDDKTADEKNKMIADWDTGFTCENQHVFYDNIVESRKKRESIDALKNE